MLIRHEDGVPLIWYFANVLTRHPIQLSNALQESENEAIIERNLNLRIRLLQNKVKVTVSFNSRKYLVRCVENLLAPICDIF